MSIYRFGSFRLSTDTYELTGEAGPMAVEPQVFQLLQFLIKNRDRVVSKDEIIDAVWDGRIVSDTALNTRIAAVRRALGDDGKKQAIIKTFPRRGFRFIAEAVDDDAPGAQVKPAGDLTSKPSIAVLPFFNLSDDPEQEYFSDGITEDIIAALSRIRQFFVIARNTTFTYKGQAVDVQAVAKDMGVRYVLEGSVRKSGNRVRISAQLIDGESGNHIWAERYDRELEDIFALQDEITETVVGAIEPELGRAERERARKIPPENLDAWTALQKGISFFYEAQSDTFEEAVKLIGRAIELDPNFALAYAWGAATESRRLGMGFGEFDRDRAYSLAQRAIQLDPQEPMAHFALGYCHYAARQSDTALEELEEALRLNPNHELSMLIMGRTLTLMGRHEDAIKSYESAMKASPRDPLIGIFYAALSLAHLLLRDYEEAVAWAGKAIRFAQARYSPAILLSALGHAGKTDEALTALSELQRMRPDLSISYLRGNFRNLNESDMNHFLEGLKKGGLPEG